MRKIDYTKAIQESVTDLEKSYSELTKPKLRDRCEVLIWLKLGKVTTMMEASELKGITTMQGQRWWRQYKKEGLSSFLSSKHKGQVSPLTDKTELQDRLSKEGFSTINEARLWILQTYSIEYTENSLGNYFRHQKIKLKTGRPHHPKKDEEKRSIYKKNMKKN